MIGSLPKLIALLMVLLLVGSTFVGGIFILLDKILIMGFFNELWNNQPATGIGVGKATLVLLGIYIFLLNTYK